MSNDKFDGFTPMLFLDEDGDWGSYLEELPQFSAFGSKPEEALNELVVVWTMVKEEYNARGETPPIAPTNKHYSGQFNIRIDKRVHRALAVEAAQAGLSLNGLVAQKLAQSVVPYNFHR